MGVNPSVAETRVRKLDSKMLQRAPVLPTLMMLLWNRFIEMSLGELGSKIPQGALVLLLLAMLQWTRISGLLKNPVAQFVKYLMPGNYQLNVSNATTGTITPVLT